MKTELWWVGKTKSVELRRMVEFYLKRIRPFSALKVQEWPDSKAVLKETAVNQIGEKILKKCGPTDILILLDESGTQMSSRQFAKYLEKLSVRTGKRIIFLIGGAYGFSEAVRKRSNDMVSVSAMTFPHDLIRIIFLEQYYRAFTIQRNLPYHHQ